MTAVVLPSVDSLYPTERFFNLTDCTPFEIRDCPLVFLVYPNS